MRKVTRIEAMIAVVVFGAVILAGIYRLFKGISVADEGIYITLANFPRIGAKWFVDEFIIQTTSAILLSPFISIYTAIFGSEAVVLYNRALYLLSATGTGLMTAYFFSRYCRWPVALVFAACVVAYVPFGMACLNYNTMGSQFFGIAAMATILGILDNSRRWSAVGGFFWVLCAFAYPTAIITFACFFAFLIIYWQKKFWRQIKYVVAGAATPAVVLVGVLLWCGPQNIANSIRISNNFNMPFQPYKILFGLNLLGSYLPPWWMVLSVFVFWVALVKFRPQFSYAGLVLFLLAYMFFGGQSESLFGSVLWTFTFTTSAIVIAQHWKSLNPGGRTLAFNFVGPAIVGALVAWGTSRMTIYNMHGTGIFAALATAVIATRQSVIAGWIVASLLLAFTLKTQFAGPYEDAAYPLLTYRMSSGPFRFMYTYPAKGETVESLQRDLSELPQYGSILYKDTFPIGYMMSPHRPIGPAINVLPAFLHPEARPIMASLYQDRKYFPDYVVEFRYFPMSSENWYYMDQNPENPTLPFFQKDPFHNFFMKSGEYSVILDRGVYRILRRKFK